MENIIEKRNEILAETILEKRILARRRFRPELLPQAVIIRLPSVQQPLIKSKAILTLKNQVKLISLSKSIKKPRLSIFN